MRTRLKDIARDLNISTGLVSGVLNGRENVWASDDTRKRIFDAANRLNYAYAVPTIERQMPASGAVEIVYCFRDDLRLDELGILVNSISESADELNLDVAVRSFATTEKACDYLGSKSSSRPELYVLWGSEQDLGELVLAAAAVEANVLVCGRHDERETLLPQCAINVEEMIMGAIDHLRVLGHNRIAYLGENSDQTTPRLMRETFSQWIKSCLGSEPRPDFVVASGNTPDELTVSIERLLALPPDEGPTALVVGVGNLAWTALEICLQSRSTKLGFGTEDFLAAGVYRNPFHLLIGDALGYDLGCFKPFLSTVLRSLLGDQAEVEAPVSGRLYLPRLARIPSLHLQPPSVTSEVTR